MIKDLNAYAHEASWIFVDAKALGNPDALSTIRSDGSHRCDRRPMVR
jgi:hypothetical protein